MRSPRAQSKRDRKSHVERLPPGTIERTYSVGDVPAQACERAAVSGGECIVADHAAASGHSGVLVLEGVQP